MSLSDILNQKENLASHYALQVALQTMKERCQNLQQRLTDVEEENLRLRMISGIDKPTEDLSKLESDDEKNFGGQNELELLRNKVAELSRQKFQLTEHIAMVATENRQLWSRLSKLTKDSNTICDENKITSSSSSSTTNLIRSKTFTQNSPNPMLRLKLHQSNEQMNFSSSNEEDDENEKSNEYPSYNNTTGGMGFGYLPDQDIDNCDQTCHNIKRLNNSFEKIKNEILWQQNDLKGILIKLQKKKENEKSNGIKDAKLKKIDKCIETDPVVVDEVDKDKSPTSNPNETQEKSPRTQLSELRLKQNYKNSEPIGRMCPMCGKIFGPELLEGNEFQNHVEKHFIEDCDTEYNSIEKNFEIVSHSVGNF